VSWLVSPESFSDHPTTAWYGAWYIAEVLNILTSNPEVWKKTVFLLTYDENDGYFDHVPPFVAPHPKKPETGKASQGIDLALEHVDLVQDRARNGVAQSRGGPIGLGYRVPMVVASPWSRGGSVCSQVFDHTSVLQFLEKLLSHKIGKPVHEPNISSWRRTVCGDLTSSFHSEAELVGGEIAFPSRYAFLQSIHEAQFKPLPTGMGPLDPREIEQLRQDRASSPRMPRQEAGSRPSAPLPYELLVNGRLDPAKKEFVIDFEVKKELFGQRSAGSPFRVHAMGYMGKPQVRDYAVAAGDRLQDSWGIAVFSDGHYHLRVDGPNGFCREFRGDEKDPLLQVLVASVRTTGDRSRVAIVVHNKGARREIDIRDNVYKNQPQTAVLEPDTRKELTIDTQKSSGWYDFTIRSGAGSRFEQRFAGRAETGQWSISDPAMG
jgi:phospholipase C